jgi:hypothetical protein
MRRAVLLLSLLSVARSAAAAPIDASPSVYAPKVDVLIVVDTSAAAAPLRAALPGLVGPFVTSLGLESGGDPDHPALDLHIGVISADPADGGVLRPTATDCTAASAIRFVAYASDGLGGHVVDNFPGTLPDALACLLAPSTVTGADVTQPFATMLTTLGGGVTENVGFRRPGAGLAVLIVTAHDDCSATNAPLDNFACAQAAWSCAPALDATPGPRTCTAVEKPVGLLAVDDVGSMLREAAAGGSIAIGVLRGEPEPIRVTSGPSIASACVGGTISATPALRIDALAGWGAPAVIQSACTPDLSGFAGQIVGTVEPPHPYDCDGGIGDPLPDGHVPAGCGCHGSSPSSGGLLLVAISMLGIARRSSPSTRCRARRARAAG